MIQNEILALMPDIQPEELQYILNECKNMTEEQEKRFLLLYRGKRKEPMLIAVLIAVGFFGVAGIHRLLTEDYVLGIIYFFTLGFCGIGTLIDLISMKEFSLKYNLKQAQESVVMAKMIS